MAATIVIMMSDRQSIIFDVDVGKRARHQRLADEWIPGDTSESRCSDN